MVQSSHHINMVFLLAILGKPGKNFLTFYPGLDWVSNLLPQIRLGFKPSTLDKTGVSNRLPMIRLGFLTLFPGLDWGFKPSTLDYTGVSNLLHQIRLGFQTFYPRSDWGFYPYTLNQTGVSNLITQIGLGFLTFYPGLGLVRFSTLQILDQTIQHLSDSYFLLKCFLRI